MNQLTLWDVLPGIIFFALIGFMIVKAGKSLKRKREKFVVGEHRWIKSPARNAWLAAKNRVNYLCSSCARRRTEYCPIHMPPDENEQNYQWLNDFTAEKCTSFVRKY
jgi:hypothetical protein